MALHVYNTLTRNKERFEPLDPERVTVYVCGPTVYGHPHIGNARPPVVFDLLHRVLRRQYANVVYARNITDVEDKINKAAADEGVPIKVITDRYTQAYHDDMGALGVMAPTIEPHATQHIDDMIVMMQDLIAKGHAYVAEGHVLFHIPSFAEYGRLSGRTPQDMIAGARVEVAPFKRDPLDFVLWKPSTNDQPGWDSPWGRGRPGWHIECSAMIKAHLGRTIDIHAGGSDLVFPHHENEIAQSTCAHDGELYCRYWMHNGYVNVNHEKMSKSLGNVLLVKDLINEAPGEAIRLGLLSAHYRSPLEWRDDTPRQAVKRLDGLYGTLRQLADVEADDTDVPEDVLAALNDDLNTPVALSCVASLARQANVATDVAQKRHLKGQLLAAGEILGLLKMSTEDWFQSVAGDVDVAHIERLVEARIAARKAKNFATADRIRDELTARGITLEDSADGTKWRKEA